MVRLYVSAKRLLAGDDGATMVEYGLMVALIAAFCIGVVTTLGQGINSDFESVSTAVG